MPDAVVDTEERLPPKLRDCTSHQSHRHQGSPHTRTWKRERRTVCHVGVIKDIISLFEKEHQFDAAPAGTDERKFYFMDNHMIAMLHLYQFPLMKKSFLFPLTQYPVGEISAQSFLIINMDHWWKRYQVNDMTA